MLPRATCELWTRPVLSPHTVVSADSDGMYGSVWGVMRGFSALIQKMCVQNVCVCSVHMCMHVHVCVRMCVYEVLMCHFLPCSRCVH